MDIARTSYGNLSGSGAANARMPASLPYQWGDGEVAIISFGFRELYDPIPQLVNWTLLVESLNFRVYISNSETEPGVLQWSGLAPGYDTVIAYSTYIGVESISILSEKTYTFEQSIIAPAVTTNSRTGGSWVYTAGSANRSGYDSRDPTMPPGTTIARETYGSRLGRFFGVSDSNGAVSSMPATTMIPSTRSGPGGTVRLELAPPVPPVLKAYTEDGWVERDMSVKAYTEDGWVDKPLKVRGSSSWR